MVQTQMALSWQKKSAFFSFLLLFGNRFCESWNGSTLQRHWGLRIGAKLVLLPTGIIHFSGSSGGQQWDHLPLHPSSAFWENGNLNNVQITCHILRNAKVVCFMTEKKCLWYNSVNIYTNDIFEWIPGWLMAQFTAYWQYVSTLWLDMKVVLLTPLKHCVTDVS